MEIYLVEESDKEDTGLAGVKFSEEAGTQQGGQLHG